MRIDIEKLDHFIAEYPVFEYQIIETAELSFEQRVRCICETECERYGTTWACPPAVGELSECETHCRSYPQALFFSTAAEVSDVMNMEEMLATRRAHERITEEIGRHFKAQGLTFFILSTESCDLCEDCAYPDAPCRFPEKMHPCLESYGIVVTELAEKYQMCYQLGGNAILWFSLILFR